MLMRSRREGFAIPMAILLIGVITAGVVGAFARVESEHASVTNRDLQTSAYALAETGMSQYLSVRQAPPQNADIDLVGGRAEIRAQVMRADDGVNGALYLIRSTGFPDVGAISPPAQHTVAQFGWYRRGTMQVVSGWTSLSGIRKNGAAGELSGIDKCGMESTLAGVAVPDGGFSGKDDAVSGDPDISQMGTPADMADQVRIDWNGIVNDGAMQFDRTMPPDAWPTAAEYAADPDWWPVIYVDGDFEIPSNGRGTLVVRNNLTVGGSVEWDGIVLVGGKLTDNGTGAVHGATVTGLNVKLGEPVEESSRANGTKSYAYDSCNVANAASQFSTLVPMRNTWLDNWAAY